MPVILDTTMLTLVLKPEIPPPNDPITGAPVTQAAERVKHLIKHLSDEGLRILIPATVWAEFLVVAGDSGQGYRAQLMRRGTVEIVPFDEISAVEAALDQRKALREGNKKLALEGSRQCVKADRQIVAIGKTRNVTVYAADNDLVKIGESMNVKVVALWDLPIPPTDPQPSLFKAASPSTEPEPPSGRSPGAEKV